MKKHDAIIILGAGINQDKSLSLHSEARVLLGLDLFKEGVSSKIILSGNQTYWNEINDEVIEGVTESGLMYDFLVSKGVPKDQLLKEEESRDTVGNALFAKEMISNTDISDLHIVTSKVALNRVEYIFMKVFGSEFELSYSIVEPETPTKEESAREEKAFDLTKQFLDDIENGDHVSIQKVLNQYHPGYGGSGVDVSSLNRSQAGW